MTGQLGATIADGKTRFAVRSPNATAVDLCLFDAAGETRRTMHRNDDVWECEFAEDLAGARYGYRAHGEWAPEHGLWFDP